MNHEKKEALLVGALQGVSKEELIEARDNDVFLVACDAGYRSFLDSDIIPDLFVGDYDTFPFPERVKAKEIISLSTHKDDTDIGYAIKVLLARGFDTFLFYGCLGGRIEHAIGNIQLLSYLLSQQATGTLYDNEGHRSVHMIKNSCIRFSLGRGRNVSIFSYNERAEGVTLEGFEYPLKDATLTSSYPLGVSNQTIEEECSISVREGTLLIVIEERRDYEPQSPSSPSFERHAR